MGWYWLDKKVAAECLAKQILMVGIQTLPSH